MMHRFSLPARRCLVSATTLATGARRSTVGTDCVLLALAGDPELAPVLARHGAGEEAVRGVITRRWGWDEPPDDGVLLAALGIDLDEVRRRVPAAGPAAWRLQRSRLRPLRVSVVGPTGAHLLSGGSRKVVEVALWRGHRLGTPAGAADLLHGILCDRASRAVDVLCELRVPVRCLIADLDAGDAGPSNLKRASMRIAAATRRFLRPLRSCTVA